MRKPSFPLHRAEGISLRDEKSIDAFSVVGIIRAISGYVGQIGRTGLAAARRWQRDDVMSLAAAVSYYLALSLFPMMLLLTGGVGLVMRYSQLGNDAHQKILEVVSEHCSPSLEEKVAHVLNEIGKQSIANGPIGFVTSLLAAVGVFYQFERAFDKIWRIPPPPKQGWLRTAGYLIRRRVSAFFLLAGVGATIVSVLIVNVVVGATSRWLGSIYLPAAILLSSLDAVITIALNALAFSVLYYKLPKRLVLKSNAFRGGLLVAIVWEGGRQVLATFVVGVQYSTAYGAIGSFIGLLLWFYWGVALLLFGAEYVAVLSRCSRQSVNLFSEAKQPKLILPTIPTLRLVRSAAGKIRRRAA